MTRKKSVVLIGGFPGIMTHFDLCRSLRARGFDVFRLSFADTSSPFAFDSVVSDVEKVLRSVNPDVVIGFCFGGWMIIILLSDVKQFSLAPIIFL